MEKVKEKENLCHKKNPEDKRNMDKALNAEFAGTGSPGCKFAFKACVKACVRPGKAKNMKMKLKKLKAEGGNIGADKGTSVEAEIEVKDDASVTISGAPLDDDAVDNPAMKATFAGDAKPSKIEIGCDTRGASGGKKGLKKRACVKLPKDVKPKKVKVLVDKSKPEDTDGRKAVEIESSGRRLSAASDSPPYEVTDETGADVTSNYKACCFGDGYGVATKAADETTCPKCATVNGVEVADDPAPSPSPSPSPSSDPEPSALDEDASLAYTSWGNLITRVIVPVGLYNLFM